MVGIRLRIVHLEARILWSEAGAVRRSRFLSAWTLSATFGDGVHPSCIHSFRMYFDVLPTVCVSSVMTMSQDSFKQCMFPEPATAAADRS